MKDDQCSKRGRIRLSSLIISMVSRGRRIGVFCCNWFQRDILGCGKVFDVTNIVYGVECGSSLSEELVSSGAGLSVGVVSFEMMIGVVLDEMLDSTRVTEDPLYLSDMDNPEGALRSSSLDSSNTRGEGAEMSGATSRLLDGKGFNCGVSSHGEHIRDVVGGDQNVVDEVGYRAVVRGYPCKRVNARAVFRNVSQSGSVAAAAVIVLAIDMAVG